MKKKITFSLFICSIIIFQSCEKTSVTRSSDNLPNATAGQIDKWEKTQTTLLGIRAFDPIEENISETCQDYAWQLMIPPFDYTFCAISTEKQNIGGILNRYGTYGEDNNSYDINLWMVIFDDYHQYYELVEHVKNEDWLFPTELIGDELNCGDDDTEIPFLLGEIAVPNSFMDNNLLFRPAPIHCENGVYLHKLDTFGMYGVVTTDTYHGHVPEVHPVQQIWFRDKNIFTKNKSSYWLLFIQDCSGRFDDWAGSPVYGQYQIAFRVNPQNIKHSLTSPLTMDISIGTKTDLVTNKFSDQRRDCDNGTSHSLIVDGKKIVTINESGGEDNDMGIQFIELAKLNDGTIQGYVQISMVIGDYDTKEFGMSILNLLITQPQNMNVKGDLDDLQTQEN